MLDHLSIQVADVDAAAAFYLRVFAALGIREAMRLDRDGSTVVGMSGPDGFPHFWLGPATGPGGREVHLAFSAPDRAAVDEVHYAAIGSGTEILHAPRVWPEYHPGYYGVFLRDLDGNNVEAVHHDFKRAGRTLRRARPPRLPAAATSHGVAKPPRIRTPNCLPPSEWRSAWPRARRCPR